MGKDSDLYEWEVKRGAFPPRDEQQRQIDEARRRLAFRVRLFDWMLAILAVIVIVAAVAVTVLALGPFTFP